MRTPFAVPLLRDSEVRTSGVVTEAPQFPIVNFHGEMCVQHVATCGNTCAHKITYDKM